MRSQIVSGAIMLAVVGCKAREVCLAEEENLATEGHIISLSSTVTAGSRVLSQGGEAETVRFDATLRGLPELWQGDSAILGSLLRASVSLRYESAPFGADGRTEMPEVRVRLDPFAGAGIATDELTPRFPEAAGYDFAVQLFPTCLNEGDLGCCPFGSQECTAPTTVQFERVDGSPYPPIVVEYSIAADAHVTTCPLGGSQPELATRVEP
jgi:hypothetical protein